MTGRRSPMSDRGAALVEYAMLVALIAVVCIGAVQRLEDSGGSKVDDGAVDRGRPSEQLFLPSSNGVIVGGGSGSTVGSGPATVQVFDIAGSADNDPGSDWAAVVTVRVKNAVTPELWSGVTVTGKWFFTKGGTPQTQVGTCTTDISGQCPISIANLKKSGGSAIPSVEFRDVVLSGPGITHQAPSPDPTSTSGSIAKP